MPYDQLSVVISRSYDFGEKYLAARQKSRKVCGQDVKRKLEDKVRVMEREINKKKKI